MDEAIGRSSRPEQLFGLLERMGFVQPEPAQPNGAGDGVAPLGGGLRVAGS
jgi:hypothetical protein